MKSAVLVWGGWAGHNPQQAVERFIPFLRENGFDPHVATSLDIYLDAELMRRTSLIVHCWTMGQITPEQEAGLLQAVRNGTGLVGWHGGLCDAFRGSPAYQFMTGGQWVAHPGNIIRYSIRITQPNHPITRGISDFEIESEQYYLHVDPSNDVLATTTFSGEHEQISWIKGAVIPVVWTRPWGAGRVAYASFGHTEKDFDIPQARQIVERAMLWAAR